MANLEVMALDPSTPQLRAPASGDGYSMPRPLVVDGVTDIQDINITGSTISVTEANGALNLNSNGNGSIVFNTLWSMTALGTFAPLGSNSIDIGSTSYRIRSFYVGTSINLSGQTVTTNTPMLNLSQTWNAAAVPFTAINVEVTNTASDSASKLMDLKLDGNSVFTVTASNLGTLLEVLDSGAATVFMVSETGIDAAQDITLADGVDIILDTTNGTKIGTSASQKLGFYNATPVVQYSTTGTTTGFTAATGTAVLSGSTFTGDSGTKAYTIGDIVKALKDLGILAAS